MEKENKMRGKRRRLRHCLLACFTVMISGFSPSLGWADKPYFITYDHEMEEPGSLEVSLWPVVGFPQTGHGFLGAWTEFEYGAKGWWTTEFYLDGQSTRHESTIFTGYRWENRFHPLMGDHRVNPVLYVEYENINGADKDLIEVVNHDSVDDLAVPNGEARRERQHEIEGKLILSSNFRGWNVSENFIAEKNLSNNPWEFGYAAGMSRPLRLEATSTPCYLCRENLTAGIEFYGGLGTRHDFGTKGTAHYAAPLVAWNLQNGWSFRISPTVGLNKNSARALLRFGVSYEFSGFGRHLRKLFR